MLKTKDCQFDNFVIIGGTVYYDNLQCHHWWQSCQIGLFVFSEYPSVISDMNTNLQRWSWLASPINCTKIDADLIFWLEKFVTLYFVIFFQENKSKSTVNSYSLSHCWYWQIIFAPLCSIENIW